MKSSVNSWKSKKNWKRKYLNMTVKYKTYWLILEVKHLKNFKKMHKEYKIIRTCVGSIIIEQTATRQSTWPMNLNWKIEWLSCTKLWIRLTSKLMQMRSLDTKTKRLSEIKSLKLRKFNMFCKKLFRINSNLKYKISVKKLLIIVSVKKTFS